MPFNSSIGGNKVVPFMGGGQVANPSNIVAQAGAPSTNAVEANIGDIYVNTTAGTAYMCVANTGLAGVTWAVLGGGSADVNTLTGDSGGAISPTGGTISLLGTANQITTTGTANTITWSLPSAITAPGSLTTTTTLTATLGDITATNGDFVASTAAKGPKVVGTSVAGASPVVNSVRAGQASFTDVINAVSFGTLTLTNTLVTSSSVIIASVSCATANTILSITAIAPGAGSVAFTVRNSAAATNTAANILINFWVLN